MAGPKKPGKPTGKVGGKTPKLQKTPKPAKNGVTTRPKKG